MIAVWIVLGVLVVLGLSVAASYNRFVTQRNLVAESWRQVDVELQRRYDLIPNLVQTVKGYAAHERQVLEAVIAARATALQAKGAGPERRRDPENGLNHAVGAVVAVAERYPDLKASRNFLKLQDELVNTEDRIAAARRFYNGNVRALNTRTASFPSALTARWFKFAKAEYFELDDPQARTGIKVRL